MKILVIGARNHQVNLIKSLPEKFVVHAVSEYSEQQVRKAADFFQVIDIKNKEAVLEYAKKIDTDLTYPVGSETAVYTAAWVSERLGLSSFVTTEAASICKIRNNLTGLAEDEAFKIINNVSEIDDFEYPFIIEPIGRQDQKGIFIINKKEDLEHKFQLSLEYSMGNCIMARGHAEDPAITVTVYMADGDINFSFISDRIPFSNPPGGIAYKHRFPSQFINEKSENNIHQLVREVVDTIGIKNGPVYFLINLQGDEPALDKIFPGFDNYQLGEIIENATGVDLLDQTVTHLLDIGIRDPKPHV